MPRLLSGVARPALVLLLVSLIVGSAGLVLQAIHTIQQLGVVEAERDRWQRPDAVIKSLDLKEGETVVDFGAGSGYFALKLSNSVGPHGEVIAVDLRRLSLFFLRMRSLLQWKNNVRTVVGQVADPHLSGTSADSVLIANTYHELTHPQAVLGRLSEALRQGGRIVIVDRLPGPGEDGAQGSSHHHVIPDAVESDLRAEGFQIEMRDDRFIAQGGEMWWLIAAVKP